MLGRVLSQESSSPRRASIFGGVALGSRGGAVSYERGTPVTLEGPFVAGVAALFGRVLSQDSASPRHGAILLINSWAVY